MSSIIIYILYLNSFSTNPIFLSKAHGDTLCPIKSCVVKDSKYDHIPGIYITSSDSSEINVRSISSGQVLSVTGDSTYFTVVIQNNNLVFCFFYLKYVRIKKGDIIKKGQLIGDRAIGEYIYIEVFKNRRRVSPLKYIDCNID